MHDDTIFVTLIKVLTLYLYVSVQHHLSQWFRYKGLGDSVEEYNKYVLLWLLDVSNSILNGYPSCVRFLYFLSVYWSKSNSKTATMSDYNNLLSCIKLLDLNNENEVYIKYSEVFLPLDVTLASVLDLLQNSNKGTAASSKGIRGISKEDDTMSIEDPDELKAKLSEKKENKNDIETVAVADLESDAQKMESEPSIVDTASNNETKSEPQQSEFSLYSMLDFFVNKFIFIEETSDSANQLNPELSELIKTANSLHIIKVGDLLTSLMVESKRRVIGHLSIVKPSGYVLSEINSDYANVEQEKTFFSLVFRTKCVLNNAYGYRFIKHALQ